MLEDLRKKENLHIVFWLIKDFAWINDFKTLGVCMAVPTLLLAFWLTWNSRRIASELFHNLAVSCWILANSVWMWGEFFYVDTLRHYAKPFFIAGLLILAGYYVYYYFQKQKQKKIK
jgi:hypothetical protein